jgi:septal ring factor EnvC (AmiA/AmiB activator)
MALPPDILWKIINGLIWVLGVFMGLGVSIFVFFHKSILRRLDSIDNDLKPITTQIAVQKERVDSLHDRLIDHEKRISKLENK